MRITLLLAPLYAERRVRVPCVCPPSLEHLPLFIRHLEQCTPPLLIVHAPALLDPLVRRVLIRAADGLHQPAPLGVAHLGLPSAARRLEAIEQRAHLRVTATGWSEELRVTATV